MQTTIDSAPDSQLLCPKNMVVGDVYWIIGFHAIECKKGSKTWGKGRPLIFGQQSEDLLRRSGSAAAPGAPGQNHDSLVLRWIFRHYKAMPLYLFYDHFVERLGDYGKAGRMGFAIRIYFGGGRLGGGFG